MKDDIHNSPMHYEYTKHMHGVDTVNQLQLGIILMPIAIVQWL